MKTLLAVKKHLRLKAVQYNLNLQTEVSFACL